MKTFDEIIANVRRPEDTVHLCLRGDLVSEFRELERRLPDASAAPANLGERAEASVIAEKMQALREQMADAEVSFLLRSLPPREWETLYGAMPVRREGEPQEAFSERFEEWTCQLVARTCVGPEMTAEQVKELVPNLSGAQWGELSNTAFRLNTGKVSIPFSDAASALTPTGGQTSRRPEQPESPSVNGSASNPDASPPTSTTSTDG